jgi:type IV pilus assembly protein PilO
MVDFFDTIEIAVENIFNKIPYAKLAPINFKGRWAMVVSFPIIIFLLVFFLFIKGVMAETGLLSEDLEKTSRKVMINRNLEKNMPKLTGQIQQLDSQLETLKRQLPGKKEIPDLLDQISNIGIQAGLKFLTFKPKSEKAEDFYALVPVKLKMLGPFHNLVSFFDQVRRMPRIITISDLTISRYKKRSGKGARETLVMAKCTAVTYRFLEARVDKPAEKEKKK